MSLDPSPGDAVFLLGANGTGKSSLMHRFYSAHHGNARRITAHRQTWFESNAITLSPQERMRTEQNAKHHDTNPMSRWKDDYAATRASMAIYDLVDAENVRARTIAAAVDNDDLILAKELRNKDAPIKIINELLRLSNIPVAISIEANANVVASKNGGTPYSIAELSDGERNAILIAANVLTAKQGTLLLIDEPERHLHRSIISPLLTLLFAKKPDCAFVVSTHDVMLSLDNPTAQTLLIRGCAYSGSSVTAWDADLVSAEAPIDDELKRDILGARRKILFVEGNAQSLDHPLYSLLFPEASVISKGSCREVESVVSSIRGAAQLHWLDAFGLVDNDRRSQADIYLLRQSGVYALSAFSVESIYYHPEVQRMAAERHAATTGDDSAECVAEALAAALQALRPHIQRLSERVAEKRVREEFFAHIPKRDQMGIASPVNFSIDIPGIVGEERTRLEESLNVGNLDSIISRYPIRETPALDSIIRKLGFQSRNQYESAVRKLLIDDAGSLAFVRSLFGTLPRDIATGTNSSVSAADLTTPQLTPN